MKIKVEVSKPRAKWLNDLLKSKRAAKHADPRNPSRSDLKRQLGKELSRALKNLSD